MARAKRRPVVPELWGWAELRKASGRSDTRLRQLRATYAEEFPAVVAELAVGSIYLADECREFLRLHPRGTGPKGTPADVVKELYRLRDAGKSTREIVEATGLSSATVYRRLSERAGAG